MKVAHVVPALFSPGGVVGGAERYVLELARHMAAEVPTTLVTYGEADRETTVDALAVRVIGGAWHVRGQAANPFNPSVFGALRHADVVHCHQQHVVTSSAVALWCRLTRRRAFVSELGGGGWDVSAYVSTDRWFTGHLHLSEYSRRVFGHAGKPWARVISCGMSLKIIGPRNETGTVEALEAKAEGKRVTFCHDADDARLVDEYRRALCVVLPSVYRSADGAETRVPELLGQTLLEAMACGTPVICTNVASMPEIVEDGVSGFVVPPNDPPAIGERLQWLVKHPAEAAEMGAAGRRRVLDRFQWAQVVGRCLDAYAAR
jgi:glycosyltransferase involved in cell wall biosynthesis